MSALAKNGIHALLLGATIFASIGYSTPVRAADDLAGGGNALEGGCGEGQSYGDIVAGFESGKLSGSETPEEREAKLRSQYSAVNQMKKADGSWLASATGRYQLNAGALESIGWIKKGSSVPMGPGEWPADIWTEEAISAGVNSRTAYLNNPAAQDTSLQLLTEVKLKAIDSSVFNNPTTPNGVAINSGSVGAAAHMMGEGAFNSWAKSGFSPSALSPEIAAAHGMSPEQYNQHLLDRMAAGACADPSAMPISELTNFDLPPIYLMEWTTEFMSKPILPGQIQRSGMFATQ